jgi:filamentous hemagglutinin family protein
VARQRSNGPDVVINWSSFNVGAGQTTQFVQPNAQAIAVNRIGGNAPSQILGTLDANGRIVLINGNGILFGQGSQVNVGSLVATSTGGSDSDVLSGKFTNAGNQNASVVNQGSIRTSQGGLVALVAPSVTNSGTVNAKFGTVALGAANKFTVDFSGDGLVSFAAQGDVNGNATAANTGSLVGANVSLTAHAAESVATGVVNMSGIIVAQTAHQTGGTITLDAGDSGNVSVSQAKLDASGANGGGTIQIGGWNEASVAVDKASVLNASAIQTGNGGSISVISGSTSFQGSALARGGISSGNGGTIETSGHELNFTGATVDAGATHGRDGSWLLDPYDLTVDSAAAATIDSSLASNTNVTLQTTATGTSGPGNPNPSGNGDIIIDSAIAWNTIATLSLSAYRNIDINADITVSGGGALAMTTGTGIASDYIIASGNSISFTGGSSSGASLAINGSPYTLLYGMSDVQGINGSSTTLARDDALANSLDASGTSSWVPIGTNGAGTVGNSGDGFTGVFAGLGNTISNLTIDLPSVSYVGLFGYSSGTIRDIGMVGGSISGDNGVGGLVGNVSRGIVEYAYATGPVSGVGEVGGLVGGNTFGSITNAYATGTVGGNDSVGGLVGESDDSTIANTYATGAVSGSSAGGLVGSNTENANITNSHATGAVSGIGTLGGLVGYNYDGGAIANDYATGTVSGSASSEYFGGLIGQNNAMVYDSYATGAVSGGDYVGGLIGQKPRQFRSHLGQRRLCHWSGQRR